MDGDPSLCFFFRVFKKKKTTFGGFPLAILKKEALPKMGLKGKDLLPLLVISSKSVSIYPKKFNVINLQGRK